MTTEGFKKVVVSTLIFGTVGFGGAAFAQGVGKVGPAPKPPVSAPATTAGAAKTAQANDANHKRIVDWFTRYQNIRIQAQMTPDEKANAHKMMTAVMTNNDGDKKSAQQLLSKMVARYTKAVSQLKALPKMPETAKLQDGYEKYFNTGRDFFSRYLKALNANKPQAAVDSLQDGRKKLGLLDVSNKALDKKLRKQYNIAPFPGS